MKKLFVFVFVVLILPSLGIGQTAMKPLPWTNVFAFDINLAFGPSSTPTWDPSVSFRWQFNDEFRIGIADVSFGEADLSSGSRYALMGGPVLEYIVMHKPNFSVSLFAGLPFQTRWGAGISSGFGAAPYASAAFDYYFSPDFALSGIGRIQYVATNSYLRTPRVLPASSLLVAFGLGFHFYL